MQTINKRNRALSTLPLTARQRFCSSTWRNYSASSHSARGFMRMMARISRRNLKVWKAMKREREGISEKKEEKENQYSEKNAERIEEGRGKNICIIVVITVSIQRLTIKWRYARALYDAHEAISCNLVHALVFSGGDIFNMKEPMKEKEEEVKEKRNIYTFFLHTLSLLLYSSFTFFFFFFTMVLVLVTPTSCCYSSYL